MSSFTNVRRYLRKIVNESGRGGSFKMSCVTDIHSLVNELLETIIEIAILELNKDKEKGSKDEVLSEKHIKRALSIFLNKKYDEDESNNESDEENDVNLDEKGTIQLNEFFVED